jgi:hypothetical protein
MADLGTKPSTTGNVVSWLTVVVAMLAMSVPYVELTTTAQIVKATADEAREEVRGVAANLVALPIWLTATVMMALLLALLLKEISMSDYTLKIAINLSTAVAMLVAGYWVMLTFRVALHELSGGMGGVDVGL